MVHVTPAAKSVTDAHQDKLDALEKKFQKAALEIGECGERAKSGHEWMDGLDWMH